MSSSPEEHPVVDATIRLPDGRRAEGPVIELGSRTVTIALRGRGGPEAETGERVRILLRGDTVGGEHDAEAYVERSREADGVQRLTVYYADADVFRDLVDGGLGRLFNRRGAYRVAPAASAPVHVELRSAEGGEVLHAPAADLSLTGVAVVMAADVAANLEDGAPMDIALRVPGAPRALTFGARVRNRVDRDGGGVRVGLDFEPERTVDFEANQERLADYVMRRQRQLLRSRRLGHGDDE